MTHSLRLRDLYNSMVRVNSDWRELITRPGGWLERLKTRSAVEYDPPLLVPWNYDLPLDLPSTPAPPPPPSQPSIPTGPPLTDAEMGIEYEDPNPASSGEGVEESYEEMYGNPPAS